MKNPLIKRIPRELVTDWKKYIALFLLLTIVIGFVSGMFVANDSMGAAADESFEKYNVEDGHFELKERASDELITAFEKEGITVYNQYYKALNEDFNNDGEKDATVRTFIVREEVNRICLMNGDMPNAADEVVMDRMHADNNGISVGDVIRMNGKDMKVVGLAAFSDYSALFESNADSMFNALTFNVAVVTKEGYESFKTDETFQYAFRFNKRPENVSDKKERSDDLVEKLAVLSLSGGMTSDEEELKNVTNPAELEPYLDSVNELTDYVPEYANQAIHFAPDDFGKDKAMGEVLMLIFIVVLAFIFAITASNTIVNESAVIGTLLSSGYTKGEILVHYITMPIVITLVSAAIGNILGYTVFKNVIASLYYNSYSLPTYVTKPNVNAFIRTTLSPVVIMLFVNFLVVFLKLRHTPLQFLRRNLSNSKRKKAIKLPNWSFLHRFRLRILIQSAFGYVTLFVGIFFVMVLLAFSLGMPATLKDYQDHAKEYIVADYQYVLKDIKNEDGSDITVDEAEAEKFSITSLKTVDGVRIDEDVAVYGYEKDSRYFKIDKDGVFVSNSYAEKFGLSEGDKVTLKEKYTEKTYDFEISGIYDMQGSIAVIMPIADFNKTFDMEEGSFSGFLSNKELTELDENNIASIMTVDDALKMANQMDHSIGGFMDYFAVACMIGALIVIFLLTKIIIERNTVSISIVKVLGFDNKEINGLYVRLTTIFVIVSSIITAFVAVLAVGELWKMIMYGMSGWLKFYIGIKDIVQIILMVIIAYLIVAVIDMRRIKKIPMTQALKDVE